MRIAFVSQPWDVVAVPADGGSSLATWTYQVARRLVRAGHEVVVYTRQAVGQPAEERDPEGVRYRRIPTWLEDRLYLPLRAADTLGAFGNGRRPFFASSLFYRRYIHRIADALAQDAVEVAHVHNFAQFTPVIRRRCPDARIVLHMHCNWLAELDAAIAADRLRHVDLVLGTSDYITGNVTARFPEVAGRCRTVFNGVETEHFGRAPTAHLRREATDDGPHLLYVGRVSPEKGVHVLVEAFRDVRARFPRAHLDVVGYSSLLPYEYLVGLSDDAAVRSLDVFYGDGFFDKVDKRIRKRGKAYAADLRAQVSPEDAPYISFLGFVPHPRLAHLYARADAFVFPSVCHEAFGIPVIEAMACGVPVVASRSGGIPEIVDDGATGLLVARDDAAGLAAAINRLLGDPPLGLRLAIEARRQVGRRFTWDRVTGMLGDALDDVFSGTVLTSA